MPTHRYEAITVTHLSTGQPLILPLHTIEGSSDGPTVGVSAVVHGDEGIGVEVVRRLTQDPDLNTLHGRLLLLPLANGLAYQSQNRSTPVDMTNLNRVFPGDPSGWLTEQLAHHITERFLNQLDAYVDLHSGGQSAVVDYVYQLNAPDLSRAFGRPFLYTPAVPYPGTTTLVTLERHVPSVVLELGGGLIPQEPYVETALRGLKNAFRTLGALPGHPDVPPVQTLLHRLDILRPRHGGLLIPEVTTLGTRISADTLLGRVVSPLDFHVLEELRSPFDAVTILVHPTLHRIEPGDYGYMLGHLATAERIE